MAGHLFFRERTGIYTAASPHRVSISAAGMADFLVNAGESGYSKKAIENVCKNVFRTATGTRLSKSMYLEKM